VPTCWCTYMIIPLICVLADGAGCDSNKYELGLRTSDGPLRPTAVLRQATAVRDQLLEPLFQRLG